MYYIAAVLIFISAIILLKAFPYVEPTFKGKFSTLMASIVSLTKEHPKALTYSIRAGLCFGSFLGLWACLAFRVKEAPFFQGSDVVGMLGICGIAGALTASNVGRLASYSWILACSVSNSPTKVPQCDSLHRQQVA